MKKIFILFLFLLSLFGTSFALYVTPTSGNLESLTDDGIVYLDDGSNIFSEENDDREKVTLKTEDNSFLPHPYTNSSDDLNITCKNGYIDIIGSDPYYNELIDSVVLSYDYDTGTHDYNKTLTLKCKPITSPDEFIKDSDINYQNIDTKDVFTESFSISNQKINIEDTDVVNKFSPNKDVDNQPTFTDIMYLQLKTISNLSSTLVLEKPDVSFSGLFVSEDKFNEYEKWIDKFGIYDRKKDFQDAFSGAITLKDIGIAQDIILGLYLCENYDNCENVIDFKHILDKTDVYTLEEIEKKLYGKNSGGPISRGTSNNNILDESIIFYDNIETVCSNITVSDNFVKIQLNGLCSLLLSDITDEEDNVNFNLGYGLSTRINNLNTIKENVSADGLNLKGIYNIYWELNNLTLGREKFGIVKKVNNETDIKKQYDLLREIAKLDLSEMDSVKLLDIDLTKKISILVKTLIIDNKDLFDLIRYNVFDYSNLELVTDVLGNDALKIGGVILSTYHFVLVGENNYDDSDLGLGIGNVNHFSINGGIHCYPDYIVDGNYFSSSCSNSGLSGGVVGGLNFEFTGSTNKADVGEYEIGGRKGVFLDNIRTDDGLRYTNLNLGSSFKIELGVRGGALLRRDNYYYLFKDPNLNYGTFLKLAPCGYLILGYTNCCSNYIVSINLDDLDIKANKFYKVVLIIDGNNWGIEIKEEDDDDGEILKKEENSGPEIMDLNYMEIGSNYEYIGFGDAISSFLDPSYIGYYNSNQWNDLIDYIKVYKKVLDN